MANVKDQDRFNKAANEFVSGHFNNLKSSLTGGDVKPVKPWFGEGGARQGALSGADQAVTAPSATEPVATPAQAALSGTPEQVQPTSAPSAHQAASNMAGTATAPSPQPSPQVPSAPFKTVLPGGITYTANDQGDRTYSMGSRGQDGFGTMTVKNNQTAIQPAAQSAAQRLTGPASGLSFEGSAQDAERFNRPVGAGPQMVQTGRMIQPISPDYSALGGASKPEGARARFDRVAGSILDAKMNSAANLAGINQAGENSRALLSAGVHGAANDLAAQRLAGDQQVNAVDIEAKRAGVVGATALSSAQQRLGTLTPGTTEYAAEERRISGIMGRVSEKAEAPNIQMVEEPVDPSNPLAGTVKRPVRISSDGSSYDRVQEAGLKNPMTMLQADPEAFAAYNKLSLDQQKEKMTLIRKRLEGQK